MKTITILGTGSLAHTIALDFKLMGHEVRLYTPLYLEYRIQKVVETHEIESIGALVGKGKIDVVTTDIDLAVKGADYICVCVPGYRHEEYARLLKGHTTADQVVITFNAALASLLYKNIWGDDKNCPVFVDTTIPPYSTRLVEPGKVHMYERHVGPISFFPAAAAEKYANNADHVHVYSMNKLDIAEQIKRNLSMILGR